MVPLPVSMTLAPLRARIIDEEQMRLPCSHTTQTTRSRGIEKRAYGNTDESATEEAVVVAKQHSMLCSVAPDSWNGYHFAICKTLPSPSFMRECTRARPLCHDVSYTAGILHIITAEYRTTSFYKLLHLDSAYQELSTSRLYRFRLGNDATTRREYTTTVSRANGRPPGMSTSLSHVPSRSLLISALILMTL